MEKKHTHTEATRRDFLKTTGALGAGLYLGGAMTSGNAQAAEALALKGGAKAVTASAEGSTRWPIYGSEEIEAVTALLKDPGYGPIAEFEEAWKVFHDCPFTKAHFNGTSALTSMLFALDLPAGSEVLVANYSTWFPVVPMRFFDLVPVFVDVNPYTMNLDLEDCAKRLTGKTRAILAVHWFGLPCEMDDITAFAKEHDLIVLEDASHAHGAKVNGVRIGNWGRMAGFSLQGSKPLPAIEGGMAMYKDRGDFERAVTYGNYELPNTFPDDSPYRKYQGTAFGSKLRIHPVAAILGKFQLEKLEERNAAGKAQMKKLNDRITQLPGLTTQYVREGIERVFYSKNMLFIDEAKAGMSRENAIAALQAEGVDVTAFTWTLLHTYPIFGESKYWRQMPVLPDAVPGCDQANRQAIQLPYWTSDQPELVEQYGDAFEKVWANRKSLA
ncbi:MAG TPA: DegT/DnrJ/EryC1/StrS family aminotransferase [Candidatus Hydrogenedentes bacterium]|nr:DegT/DnrJ/EryC1/StrS family aminotransferase [Candidatus Hydrogenedentota bacterium]HOD94986.1 DegT/DnrJ/EryC1/StrS family aminotransferase [Candidatus Hydrogenedentota bacterium]HOH41860.1 DegT/DnrJ/EryC1/StrS family aminotransferase [Candidatus Hydrogenedentota bacterium]HPK23841.1 DegT/DnrJ/EryC1/StrS family aminotransferase [Candidatus Hydrogenedentota bacterium]HPX87176.1 DegT/DnrJ/EryC1/StrS family aminotransferase [Candidatus Hydrogenedentota bacterium]